MYKYILLFNGRSAEFTDLQAALHVGYLLAVLFDVDIIEYTTNSVNERDKINGILSIKRGEVNEYKDFQKSI